MGGKGKSEKSGVTPNKTIAYMEHKSGKSQQRIADEFGVTQQAVSKWVGEIDEFIKSSPEYQEIAPRLAKMIPTALGVYERNMAIKPISGNPDVVCATNILKGIGVFVEKSKVDNTHTLTDSDLLDKLNKLGDSNAGSESDQPDESGTEG
jgi:transposase-like protein